MLSFYCEHARHAQTLEKTGGDEALSRIGSRLLNPKFGRKETSVLNSANFAKCLEHCFGHAPKDEHVTVTVSPPQACWPTGKVPSPAPGKKSYRSNRIQPLETCVN